MAETPEDGIRERAYRIWEASGRPVGRDEESGIRRANRLLLTTAGRTLGCNGANQVWNLGSRVTAAAGHRSAQHFPLAKSFFMT